jgi:hypothetical protein
VVLSCNGRMDTAIFSCINVLSLSCHGPVLLFGSGSFRTAEDQQDGRIDEIRHRRGAAHTGAQRSGANGAGSAVDGTPRPAMVSGDTVRCDRDRRAGRYSSEARDIGSHHG